MVRPTRKNNFVAKEMFSNSSGSVNYCVLSLKTTDFQFQTVERRTLLEKPINHKSNTRKR